MTDVTIPADKAKTIAQYHRDRSNASQHVVSTEAAQWHRETADLLDPQPPTLREQVRAVIWPKDHTVDPGCVCLGCGRHAAITYAVLAVVADWLAAQPVQQFNLADPQRDHDVRLLRGES